MSLFLTPSIPSVLLVSLLSWQRTKRNNSLYCYLFWKSVLHSAVVLEMIEGRWFELYEFLRFWEKWVSFFLKFIWERVCVQCVCVCERERERERENKKIVLKTVNRIITLSFDWPPIETYILETLSRDLVHYKDDTLL
jgi:hypothetical protein